MTISSLSYIGVNSDKMEDWSEFSQKCLGMQQVDRGKGALSFRMDDHKQRLAITGDTGDNMAFMGWEVESKNDIEFYANKLDKNKVEVVYADKNLCDKRFVEELIFFNDPQGNRIEIVYNPMKDEEPFVPGRPISGFKTGPYGMGHIVINVKEKTCDLSSSSNLSPVLVPEKMSEFTKMATVDFLNHRMNADSA